PQVHRPRREVDAHRARDHEHAIRSSSVITSATQAADTRLGSTISIVALVPTRIVIAARDASPGGSILTTAGTKLTAGDSFPRALVSRDASRLAHQYSRRGRRPSRNANARIDSPLASQAASTCRASTSVQSRSCDHFDLLAMAA